MSAFDVFRASRTVRRRTGSYVNGVWTTSPDSTISISASVQPAQPKDLETLPEGRRVSAAFRLYTSAVLQVGDAAGQQADIVEIDGDDYEIHQLAPWQNGLINHNRYLAVRFDDEG